MSEERKKKDAVVWLRSGGSCSAGGGRLDLRQGGEGRCHGRVGGGGCPAGGGGCGRGAVGAKGGDPEGDATLALAGSVVGTASASTLVVDAGEHGGGGGGRLDKVRVKSKFGL